MKFRLLVFTCALALIFSCGKNNGAAIEPPPYSVTPDDSVIIFPDSALNVLIRNYIEKPSGPILYRDIKNLNTIDALDRNFDQYVKSLEGVQYCTNLKTIRLYTQDVDNLNVFKNLSSLTSLIFYAYGGTKFIKDLRPLQDLQLLQEIQLHGNSLTDISPLLNLSTHLKVLGLTGSQLLSAVNIEKLVNLEYLDLSSTNTSDIARLQNLRNLRYLLLNNNHIADVTPLKDLKELKYLLLDGNSIFDLTPLGNLTQLTRLSLIQNNLTDISTLGKLVVLGELFLNNNHISDLSALQSLNQLEYLAVDRNDISDIMPLINGVSALEILSIYSQSAGIIAKTQKDAFLSNHPNAYAAWDE